LNLEAVTTILLAVLFGEHLGARLLGAAALIVVGATFAGAVLAVVLGDRLGAGIVAGALLIMIGIVVMLGEQRGHRHIHQAVTHDHSHRDDEHHADHEHASTITGSHSHTPIAHIHPHLPDAIGIGLSGLDAGVRLRVGIVFW
jgi:hypothetical protein